MQSNSIGIAIIVLGILGLYLTNTGKLNDIISTVLEPTTKGPSLGKFGLAFVIYIGILSFIDDQNAGYLTGLLVLGGLIYYVKPNSFNNLGVNFTL